MPKQDLPQETSTVTLDGNPLSVEGAVSFSLRNSTESVEHMLTVSSDTDEMLRGMKGFHTLRISTLTSDERQNLQFSRVMVVERRPVGTHHAQWTLVDGRWPLRNVRVSAEFNVTAAAYEPTDEGTATLIGDNTTVYRGGFIASTMQDPADIRFYDRTFAGDPVPWTTEDALKWLLSRTGGLKRALDSGMPDEFIPLLDTTRMGDRGKVLCRDIVLHETRLPDALAEVLGQARCGLYVDPLGVWVVYDLAEPFWDPSYKPFSDEPGFLPFMTVSYARNAPARVRVRFPAFHEVLVRFDESRGTAGPNPYRDLDNVLMLPDNVDDPATGRRHFRGEWVTISEALRLWGADWSHGQQLSTTDIAQRLFSTFATYEFCIDGSELPPVSQRRVKRLTAIQNHWRITYRLPKALLEEIESWEPIRVQLVDPVFGTRVQSPVWSDHCRIYRVPIEDKDPAKAAYAHNSVLSGDERDLPTESVASARLSVVDQRLGIFQVVWIPLSTSAQPVADIERSALADTMTLDPVVLESGLGVNESTAYAADHRMYTVISVRFRATRALSFTTVSVDPKQVPEYASAEDPIPLLDLVRHSQPAAYEWRYGVTELLTGADGGPEITDPSLVNGAEITAAAQEEAATRLADFMNRPVGSFISHSYDPARDEPQGYKNSVSFVVRGGKLDIVSIFPEVVPAQDMYADLDPLTRQIMYREAQKAR